MSDHIDNLMDAQAEYDTAYHQTLRKAHEGLFAVDRLTDADVLYAIDQAATAWHAAARELLLYRRAYLAARGPQA